MTAFTMKQCDFTLKFIGQKIQGQTNDVIYHAITNKQALKAETD